MIKLHSVDFYYDYDLSQDNLKVVEQSDGSLAVAVVNNNGEIVDDGTLMVIKKNRGGLPDVEILGSALVNERIG